MSISDDTNYWRKVGAEDQAIGAGKAKGRIWLWGFVFGVLAAYPLWWLFWRLAAFYRWAYL